MIDSFQSDPIDTYKPGEIYDHDDDDDGGGDGDGDNYSGCDGESTSMRPRFVEIY